VSPINLAILPAKMRHTTITALLVFMLLLQAPLSHAGDSSLDKVPGEKSMRIVQTLSLLPINGPALFYAGHPVQGSLVTLSESLSILLSIAVLSSNCYSVNDCEGGSSRIAYAGGITLFLWAPAYIYTLIQAPRYVEQYNKELREKKYSIAPWIDIQPDKEKRVMAGLSFQF
jgi:hypothetical protein